MSEFNGTLVGLYISTNLSSPAYLLAVCATSHKFDRKMSPIDTSSKCDDKWGSSMDGKKTWTVSMDGMSKTTPGSGKMSTKELDAIYTAGTLVLVKIADDPTTPVNVNYSGTARITSFSETYGDNEAAKVTIDLEGVGPYTNNLS